MGLSAGMLEAIIKEKVEEKFKNQNVSDWIKQTYAQGLRDGLKLLG